MSNLTAVLFYFALSAAVLAFLCRVSSVLLARRAGKCDPVSSLDVFPSRLPADMLAEFRAMVASAGISGPVPVLCLVCLGSYVLSILAFFFYAIALMLP